VGEHAGGGAGVTQRVVGPFDRDVVPGAQVGQAVGQLSVGVEPAGEAKRAQPAVEPQRHAVATGGPLEELGVEVRVVGSEHGAVESTGQLGEGVVGRGRVTQRAAGDPVDPPRPHPAPWPREPDERGPLVEDGAVGLDGDQPDLEDAVALARQPGRLQVDDGEPRHSHPVDSTTGVSQVVQAVQAGCCI
jgi:hypothetical protein